MCQPDGGRKQLILMRTEKPRHGLKCPLVDSRTQSDTGRTPPRFASQRTMLFFGDL